MLPHFAFSVAVDTAAGGLVLRDLAIPPAAFSGSVRIEGLTPGARSAERASFSDSVRFNADGTVLLLVADAASSSPVSIEPVGARGARGGRLVIRGSNWPFGRVLLVTIDPLDLHEMLWRGVGYGVRDRVRVDDRRGIAFVSDSAAGGGVLAVAIGRATRGRIQTDVTSIVIERRFGEETGRERRQVAKLQVIIEPARDEAGTIRAELAFGVGSSEEEAAREAQAAASEAAAAPASPALRMATPSADLGVALAHALGSVRPMLDFDQVAGARAIPGGAREPLVRPRDAYYGALAAVQLGEPGAVCSTWQLFKRSTPPGSLPRPALATRWGQSGLYFWTDNPRAAVIGDEVPYLVHLGYVCYRALRDPAWLAAELPTLRQYGRMIQQADHDGDGLPETRSDGTWAGLSALMRDSVHAVEDPYVSALAAAALDRLAELEETAGGGVPSGGATWRETAERIRAALPLLWRLEHEWFAFQTLPDNSSSFDQAHIQGAEVLAWAQVSGDVLPPAVAKLLRPGWWDAGAKTWLPAPSAALWLSVHPDSVSLGMAALDFRALAAAFQHGDREQREVAFQRLNDVAGRLIRANFGRPGPRHIQNGTSVAAAGALVDLVGRVLFGVDERLDLVIIAPRLGGIADEVEWRLGGWRITGDSLAIAYRPEDRAAAVRLGAPRRVRLALRFPWLVAGSCVTVRRGPDAPERLLLVAMADGSFYVDVRAGFEPAEVRLSASSCRPA